MKLLSVFLFSAAAIAPAAAGAAAPTFSDRICTSATQPVIDYTTQVQNLTARVDDLIVLAEKVVTAYDQCAADKASDNGNDVTSYPHEDLVETMHYAQLQSARYRYAIGHMQLVYMQRYDEARSEFTSGLKLVNDIIEWRSPAQSYFSSNDVNVGSGSSHNTENYSNYRTGAMAVRDAIQKELDVLNKAVPPKQ